jgi:hypothetical protein
VASAIFNHTDRLRSYEILAKVRTMLGTKSAPA